jgi:hypothetical protein
MCVISVKPYLVVYDTGVHMAVTYTQARLYNTLIPIHYTYTYFVSVLYDLFPQFPPVVHPNYSMVGLCHLYALVENAGKQS